ncbi:MAG: tyrosine-type recombinase/integrase, partial [Solirubrobacteraceae bacterium]
VGKGQVGSAGPRRRLGARADRPAPAVHRRRRLRVRRRQRPTAQRRRAELPVRAGAPGRGTRRLRFHDLRHTFGTRMIREADIRRVQEWMGHADIQTTMKYLHHEPRKEDAALVARAFATAKHSVDDAFV